MFELSLFTLVKGAYSERPVFSYPHPRLDGALHITRSETLPMFRLSHCWASPFRRVAIKTRGSQG